MLKINNLHENVFATDLIFLSAINAIITSYFLKSESSIIKLWWWRETEATLT